VLSGLGAEALEALQYDWQVWARKDQLPPKACSDGQMWNTWLILAGRGWGKTRTGAEWVRSLMCGATPLAKGQVNSIAIIGETSKDVRDVLVEGRSGVLACHPKAFRPIYQPSMSRLTWPNGAIATLYNGTEPDQLRGPQFEAAWCDEMAKWRYASETWDMLQFGLRLGDHPRAIVTTTPRPVKILKDLLIDERTVVTRGKTYENEENLAASFLAAIRKKYEGTRLGRQELAAEILQDDANALWRRSKIDETRKKRDEVPELVRVVVAVDPAAKSRAVQASDDGAETGIVVAGLGVDGRGYVLDDMTCHGDPNEWGRRAVSAYDLHDADVIVAEINNGGEMVTHTIKTVRETINVKGVTASRGKVTRAEPIAALYEQGRVSHVGSFPALEDQMTVFNNINPDELMLKDRVDALVWAMAELFPQIVRKKQTVDWSKDSGGRNGGGSWMTS
jgi:phage terminase large subunit-like protein